MRQTVLDLETTPGSNAGLMLQRFLPKQSKDNVEAKATLFDRAIQAAGHPETCEVYDRAFARWAKNLAAFKCADFEVDGRLIVGFGTANVLETGIRLNHLYGMPILPGSALKGISSHFCDQVVSRNYEDREQEKWKKGGEHHQRLFGTEKQKGWITFHDSWFVSGAENRSDGSPLRRDVLTPHHMEWLQGVAPTDFDNPNPISFLSATGKFRVALEWSGPQAMTEDEKASVEGWLKLALDILTEAIGRKGIGSKSSSGYGRLFDLNNKLAPLVESPKSAGAGHHTDGDTIPTRVGEIVPATWLNQRSDKSDKYKAEYRGLIGGISNSSAVPADKLEKGAIINLKIVTIFKSGLRFQYNDDDNAELLG